MRFPPLPAVALQTKFSLSNKFSKNFESMQNTFTLVLSTSRKNTNESLKKSFGECCRSAELTGASYWPSSRYIPAQKFVSVSAKLNHNLSRWP